MIKAIIFDMDGVIVNTEPVYEKAFPVMLKQEYGIDRKKGEGNSMKGLRDKEIFEFLKKQFGIEDSVEELVEKRDKQFFKFAEEMGIEFEGANECLKRLSQEFQLALTTSRTGPTFDYETKTFDISLFKVVINGDDVKEGKPDPECYNVTIQKLGLNPEECTVVEDSLNGVKAGKATGAKCIGVLGSFSEEELKEAGADIVVPNIADINKEIIERLN